MEAAAAVGCRYRCHGTAQVGNLYLQAADTVGPFRPMAAIGVEVCCDAGVW